MYFSRLRPRVEATAHPAFWRMLGDGYQVHRLLWNLFADAPDRERDFLYRHEPENGRPVLYVVSARLPHDPDGLWKIDSKEYRPRLHAGDRLVFSATVNPIVSRRDENGRQHRHDVVMEAKHRLRASETPKEKWPSQAELVQTEGASWLAARAEANGFAVSPESMRADGYRQVVYRKRGKPKPVRLSVMDVTGLLSVTNPETFAKTLMQGIGPAKSFGCGLLLVRRP